jgi:hypothetical protein
MLYNTRNILYLFDFDGTLCGDNMWYGFWKNTYSAFKNGPYINPHHRNIKWSILTARPKMDYYLIKLICSLKGLNPDKIYTGDTFRYKFKHINECYEWKVKKIKRLISEGKAQNKDLRIYYIDADMPCISFINGNKDNFDMQGLTTFDFIKGNFNHY